MSMPEFIELVRRMREAQRLYFRGRDPQVLQESKRLEREVDKAILELRGGPMLFTAEGGPR